MFVGHLAVALGAKQVEPELPLSATVAAAFGLDLIWPVLLLVGVESVRVNPGDTAFTHLAFDAYPWSHSLLMVVAWSALAAFLGRRVFGTTRAGVVLGALVMSHWVLDLVTHRPDLPLWPGGPVMGLGLWNSVVGTIVVEGTLLAVGLWLYRRVSSPLDRTGTWAPSATAVASVTLGLWLLPLWAWWIERHRTVASGGT